MWKCTFVFAVLVAAGRAEQPIVTDNGILNLASQVTVGNPGYPASPGSLLLIVGKNLASSTQEATKPYPTSLAGVQVTFNGKAAPIQSVQPERIVVQVPWQVAPEGVNEGVTTVVVTRDGESSWGNAVAWRRVSPGIFTVQFRARGLAQAVDAESGVLAQPENIIPNIPTVPITKGRLLRIYASGLGLTNPPGINGADSSDVSRPVTTLPEVLIGNKPAEVRSARLSPQIPGVYEVDVIVPLSTVAGSSVPVQIKAGGITTTSLNTMAVALSVDELTSSLSVSASEVLRPFSDQLLGQATFVSWQPYLIDKQTGQPVPGAMDLYTATRTGIVGHYPGVGVITHDFQWKNVIGPVEQRIDPTPRQTTFDTPRMKEYGPDEYGRFVEQVRTATGRNVEGSIQINIVSGSAEDAADWVEYMNAPNDGSNPRGGTDWAAVRAQNGHPDPYRIRYWELGNEPNYTAEGIGSLTAWDYADRCRHYAWRMKQVDASIEISAFTNPFFIGDGPGAIGNPTPDEKAGPPPIGISEENLTWSQVVIKYAGDYLDHLHFHWYSAWNQSVSTYDFMAGAPYSGFEPWLDRLLLDVETYSATPDIKERLRRIIVPEWNTYGGWFRPLAAGTAVQGAIGASRMLHVFSKRPEIVMAQRLGMATGYPNPPINAPEPMATAIDFRVGYFSIFYDGSRLLNTALAEMHRIWGLSYLPQSVRISSRLPQNEKVPQADISALRSDDGTKLNLILTNPTSSELVLSISLDSFRPDQVAKVYSLSGASLLDDNTYDQPNRVVVRETSLDIPGATFIVRIPAFSIRAIHLTGSLIGG